MPQNVHACLPTGRILHASTWGAPTCWLFACQTRTGVSQHVTVTLLPVCQDFGRLAGNLPLAAGALWYRAGGNYRGDDMLPFLVLEMWMAMRRRNQSSVGTDELIDRSPLDEGEQLAIERARIGPLVNPQGAVTVRTNASGVRGAWRCAPLSKNAHSLRVPDPYDGDPRRLIHTPSIACMCVHVRGASSRERRRRRRMSPTQTAWRGLVWTAVKPLLFDEVDRHVRPRMLNQSGPLIL